MLRGFKKKIGIVKEKVGFERRQELLDDIDNKGTFLPKGVNYEDMDETFVEFIKNDLTKFTPDLDIPVIFLTIQRWSEFTKTWQFTDEYSSITMPFITIVRKPDIQVGVNQKNYWNEASSNNYSYIKIPTFEGGRKGIDLYKIPQPTSVDLTYEVRLFCNRMNEVNSFNHRVQKIFNSRQHYIYPKQHPMPLHLETISDESKLDDFINRKFYSQKLEIKLLGYILDEEDFEIVSTINRLKLKQEIIITVKKPIKVIETIGKIRNLVYDFIVEPKTNNKFKFVSDYSVLFKSIELFDIASISFSIDGKRVNIPFSVLAGQEIVVKVNKNFYKEGKFKLIGEINEF